MELIYRFLCRRIRNAQTGYRWRLPLLHAFQNPSLPKSLRTPLDLRHQPASSGITGLIHTKASQASNLVASKAVAIHLLLTIQRTECIGILQATTNLEDLLTDTRLLVSTTTADIHLLRSTHRPTCTRILHLPESSNLVATTTVDTHLLHSPGSRSRGDSRWSTE